MEKKEQKTKKANLFDYEQFYIIVFFVLILIFSFIFLSFSFVKLNKAQNKGNAVIAARSSAKIDVTYAASEYIAMDNALPLTDESGMKLSGAGNVMQFTITNADTSSGSASYQVYAVVDGSSTLDSKYVKIYLEKDNSKVFAPQIFNSTNNKDILDGTTVGMLLDAGDIKKNTSISYKLRIWIDENYDNYKDAKSFKIYIKVIGRQS